MRALPPPRCRRRDMICSGTMLHLLVLGLATQHLGVSEAKPNPKSGGPSPQDVLIQQVINMDGDMSDWAAMNRTNGIEFLRKQLVTGLHYAVKNHKSDYVKVYIEKGQRVWDHFDLKSLESSAGGGKAEGDASGAASASPKNDDEDDDSPNKDISKVDKTARLINQRHPDSLQSPLMHAVLSGRVKTVSMLLDKGADVTIPEKDGYTPMHGAAFQGRPEIAQKLLDHDIPANDVHSDGYQPIHRACWGQETRHTKTVEVLVNQGGVPWNQKGKDGKTCADVTSNSGTKKFLKKAEKEANERAKKEAIENEGNAIRAKLEAQHEELHKNLMGLSEKGMTDEQIREAMIGQASATAGTAGKSKDDRSQGKVDDL
ncbi:unnamed protein product [Amoebophrya sp. A25]|nr:unnamed protein product [Amoebophrya sp. A25]|eukprot:GSA25T00017711001.1